MGNWVESILFTMRRDGKKKGSYFLFLASRWSGSWFFNCILSRSGFPRPQFGGCLVGGVSALSPFKPSNSLVGVPYILRLGMAFGESAFLALKATDRGHVSVWSHPPESKRGDRLAVAWHVAAIQHIRHHSHRVHIWLFDPLVLFFFF